MLSVKQKQQLAFWQRTLAGELAALDRQTDRRLPEPAPSDGGTMPLSMSGSGRSAGAGRRRGNDPVCCRACGTAGAQSMALLFQSTSFLPLQERYVDCSGGNLAASRCADTFMLQPCWSL